MNDQSSRPMRPATYQDVLDAPPNMVAELIRGGLHLHPRPRPRHARAIASLTEELVGAFDKGRRGPGGWWILVEPELHLGPNVLVPDLAGWRRERLPSLPEEVGVSTPPDWACEVLSPSTRTYDVTEKRDLYAEHRVTDLWLVDPQARTLEGFTLRRGVWTLSGAFHDDAEVRLAPFTAAPFPLSALWAD